MLDRYGSDIFAADPHRQGSFAHRPVSVEQPAELGLVVEDVTSGWAGAIVHVEKSGGRHIVVLADRHGNKRSFPLGPGFWLEGRPVTLVPPVSAPKRPGLASAAGRKLTASGSVQTATRYTRARVARASRIWVEGRHDAELVEKVWGDDLRHEGVVVQLLEGADNLIAVLEDFAPSTHRRAGVLLDHLVPGSKETRIAAAAQQRFGSGLLLLGHPYVDVWQAVKPARVGLTDWPQIARGTDIKVGTLQALGWPAASQADIAAGWQRILRQVRDYRDLEVPLLNRMEALIDFVTAAPGDE